MLPDIINEIKECLTLGNIYFKKHALIRVVERKISLLEIEEVLSNPGIVESYHGDSPLPSYLLSGFTTKNRPLHIVIALDKNAKYIWIITAYEPDSTMWSEDFLKRKKS